VGLTAAALQFLYMLLVGTFPFNAFLAGFFSSLSFLVLTGASMSTAQSVAIGPGHLLTPTVVAVCLRLQVDPSSKEFAHISPERAYADYVLANLVLYLAVWNYIG
jgi:oligosaccharyltransferase complex subunit epsilon